MSQALDVSDLPHHPPAFFRLRSVTSLLPWPVLLLLIIILLLLVCSSAHSAHLYPPSIPIRHPHALVGVANLSRWARPVSCRAYSMSCPRPEAMPTADLLAWIHATKKIAYTLWRVDLRFTDFPRIGRLPSLPGALSLEPTSLQLCTSPMRAAEFTGAGIPMDPQLSTPA